MKRNERLRQARKLVHGLLDVFLWLEEEPEPREREAIRQLRRLALKLVKALVRP